MTSSKENACCETCQDDRFKGGDGVCYCPKFCHPLFPSTPKTEKKEPLDLAKIETVVSKKDWNTGIEFSGATFEQHHEHKTEEWEEEFTRRFLDYFDDGSKSPNIKPFHEIRAFIADLILKTKDEGRKEGNSGRRMYELGKKEGYDKGVAEWYKDEEYERGKKEGRESLAAEYAENHAVILVGPTDNRRTYFSLKSVEFQERVAKKEERERILAAIDSLPDLKPEGTHKWIDAHTLVCAIQEQEKKEA